MNPAKNTIFVAAPWTQGLERKSPAALAVREWWDSAQRVYPVNTQRAWRADWHAYEAFYRERDLTPAPATASLRSVGGHG